MAPRKQTVIHNSVSSKGKANNTAGGMIPPLADDQQRATEDTGSSSPQGVAASIQPTPLFEGQMLQMLVDMKKQMKGQQIRSDHD